MKKYTFLPAVFLALSLSLSTAVPALAAPAESEPFSVDATAAILMDAEEGVVLYEQAADELRYPASITKVMTGLLTVEAIDAGALTMDTQVTLGDDLYTGIGADGSTQGLQTGEILTVRDLLYCALLPSANEACNALATAVAGDIPSFVARMNDRAKELGMDGTHFANTHGYHDDNHYTTARDVAVMCREAMEHPQFREIVSSVSYVVPATNLHGERTLHDTNALVSNNQVQGFLYPYAIGIKTGSTPEAGACLASAAEKDGRTVIAVVLGGKGWRTSETNNFSESRKLLDHGLNDFSKKKILDSIEPMGTVPVTLCAQQDYVTVQPAQSLEALLPNEVDPADFKRDVKLPETLEAPIEKGQKLGTVTLTYGDEEYGTIDLVASSALERSQFLYVKQQVLAFLDQLWVKIALLAVVLLILFFVVRRLLFGGSRKRGYGGGYRGRRR